MKNKTIVPFRLACIPLLLSLGGSVLAQEAVDNDKLFKEGIFLREQGQTFSAIEALETVLSNNPSLNRARLELAVAYFRAMNYDQAMQHAKKVLDDPKTPDNVRLAIESFLAEIKRDQVALLASRNTWEFYGSLGGQYDTNVNVGPGAATLPGGLVLAPGSTPRSDWAAVLQGGATHTYNSPSVVRIGETAGRFIWQTGLGVYHKQYFNETQFNLTALSVSTGPGIIVPNKWRAKLNLQLDGLYQIGRAHV
jgi:tetratricopeptide (TPR) repeat protein